MSSDTLAGTCPSCGGESGSGLPTNDFSVTCSLCQEVEQKSLRKMGRPRTRSSVPIHRTPGRAGYRAGCGCPECRGAHAAYQDEYNARKRTNARNANDTESAA